MANPKKGTIRFWKEDKGYGFIQPDDGGDDVFLHITDLPKWQRRPRKNERIYYQAECKNEKLRATTARLQRPLDFLYGDGRATYHHTHSSCGSHTPRSYSNPVAIGNHNLLISLVTFAVYGMDKFRAGKGMWRISEGTLHLLELLGGWERC